jgi:hypothetical protein
MHKSALTFGLLASSLVMLLIIPFLNSNNSFLSNTAMAQGDEKYGDSKKDNRDNKTGAQGNAGPSGITNFFLM